jgi:DNA-binding NarL/FixJ family response regulator
VPRDVPDPDFSWKLSAIFFVDKPSGGGIFPDQFKVLFIFKRGGKTVGLITVLVADDHAVVREGLRQTIRCRNDMKLVGEAANGEDALRQIKKLKPDVAIFDILMPGLSGIECIPLARSFSKRTQVIILSQFSQENFIQQALIAGALGYVSKAAPVLEVIEAIHKVAQRHYFLGSEINAGLIQKVLASDGRVVQESGNYDLLSLREKQIFNLVLEGYTTRGIADLLYLSPKTVEKHRSNMCKKLGMSDPLAMMKYAIKRGLADPSLWAD